MDYPIEQIKEHIDNAHCNAHYECADQLYVIGQALTALAMMEFNAHLYDSKPIMLKLVDSED